MPFSSKAYWSGHYSAGRRSGGGSYGKLAAFEAEVLNGFVRENAIGSVIEFGCGDGNQLGLSNYPAYLGSYQVSMISTHFTALSGPLVRACESIGIGGHEIALGGERISCETI